MKMLSSKLHIALGAVLLGCVSSSIATAGVCEIDTTNYKQVIRGFGASYGSDWTLPMSEAAADKLFSDQAHDQIGLNILRVRIDHTGSWDRELFNAYKAQSRGAMILATSWTPPASMKNNNALHNINNLGTIKSWPFTNVAQYLGSYVRYMKKNGINLYAISVQNEPGYAVDYEGANWTNWGIKDLVSGSTIINGVRTSHRSIIKAGTDVRIMVGETFNNNTSFVDNIFNVYPNEAKANIDLVGTHLYGGQHVSPAKHSAALAAGKEVWQTEFYLQKTYFNYENIMDCAVQSLEGLIRSFSQAQMSAWIQWFAEGSSDRIIDANGKVTKMGYGLAHFSKFVENKYRRVETKMNPTPGVYTISFKAHDSNRFVIVAVNRNETAVRLQPFQFKGTLPGTMAEVWTTDETNDFKKVSNVTVSGNGFMRTLNARSVTTFVFNY